MKDKNKQTKRKPLPWINFIFCTFLLKFINVIFSIKSVKIIPNYVNTLIFMDFRENSNSTEYLKYRLKTVKLSWHLRLKNILVSDLLCLLTFCQDLWMCTLCLGLKHFLTSNFFPLHPLNHRHRNAAALCVSFILLGTGTEKESWGSGVGGGIGG